MIALALAWLRAFRWPLIGGAVLVLITAGLCRGRSTPLPKAEQKTVDSLAIMKARFDSLQRARAHTETTFVRQRVQAVARADTAAVSANAFGHVADSLQRLAEQERDTSSLWRATALERKQQADSLAASNGALRVALAADTVALTAADDRAAEERRRRQAAEQLIPRLVADVKGARGGFFTRLKERVGASVGYGIVASNDGSIHHGPTLSVGVKVWP